MRLRHAALCLTLAACASAGDPPGGPPDEEAPYVVEVVPESGSVLVEPPGEVSIVFNEVISERVAGNPPHIAGAVLLSPAVGETRVSWKRTRLTVRPREGFRPDRVYRLEVLPVITDLRQNRLGQGTLVVFSTGPQIPSARISGAVVDWPGARPAPGALIEAVLLPDSLPYRGLADSTGWFEMAAMPPGSYVVYGIVDANGDRRLGSREAYDSVTVELADSARVEVFAFAHDTVGPRIRQVEPADSLTVRLVFDRPIDPAFVLDTSLVTLAGAEDTTARLPIAGVLTQVELDSMRAREERERARERESADSARSAADSTVRPGAPARPAAAPAPRRGAARGAEAPGAGRGAPPLDSTLAERMLARRPPPSDTRYLRLASPLEPEVRYAIIVEGVRGLLGAVARSRGQVQVRRQRPPAAPAPGPTAPDSTPRDASAADTARAAAGDPAAIPRGAARHP